MGRKRRADVFKELQHTGPELCVAIANSALPPPGPEDRRKKRPLPPRLESYTDLVDLGRRVGALSPTEAERLLRAAAERDEEAAAVFERVREMRSFLLELCQAFASGHPPSTAQIVTINGYLAEARPTLRLVSVEVGIRWGWEIGDNLERIIWRIAVATAYLAGGFRRVRRCAAKGCRFLFYDHGTNNQRRWCDMKTCGNSVKSQRAYARLKAYVARN